MNLWWFAAAVGVFVFLSLIFRDPHRSIPPAPLGVVSPVDGRVVAVEVSNCAGLNAEAHRIVIRINSFGTYTARCPVEGKIMDLASLPEANAAACGGNGLWVQTDEGEDVILQFSGYRYGFAPAAFARYGERLGQGMRCAYLRLTRFAEVHVPIDSKILVNTGQRVVAGRDLIAKVPPP